MSGIHAFFARGVSAAVVFVFLAVGCSDVGYNPYVQNDAHRPVGKQVEDVMEEANDAVSTADARFENAFN